MIHLFVILLVCFSAMFGVGFLLSGVLNILSLSPEEQKCYEQKVKDAERISHWKAYQVSREVMPPRMILEHWRTDAPSRRSIWFGLLLLAVAGIAALFK